MRIRTIKPEFWTSQDVQRLTDFAKLTAIGLLNYADDDGYFYSAPILVRGAIFPFENDLSKIAAALKELEAIGYVAIRNSKDGRELGYVVNFRKHQCINRPSPSKIKDKFTEDSRRTHGALTEDSLSTHGGLTEHSLSTHGGLTEHSWTEGKGREGKGTGKGMELTPSSVSEIDMIPKTMPIGDTDDIAVKGSLSESDPDPLPTELFDHDPSPTASDSKAAALAEEIETFKAAWAVIEKPFAKVRAWTHKRMTALKARMNDPFWRENWRTAMSAMTVDPFCRGKSDSGWVADVDYFLRRDTVVKLTEKAGAE